MFANSCVDSPVGSPFDTWPPWLFLWIDLFLSCNVRDGQIWAEEQRSDGRRRTLKGADLIAPRIGSTQAEEEGQGHVPWNLPTASVL